jgi:hypothetical protein
MNRKVVWNACYGGFGLSPLATKMFYELKHPGETIYFYERKSDWETEKDTYTKIPEDKIEGFKSSFNVITLSKDLGNSFTLFRGGGNSELYQEFIDHFICIPNFERHDPDLVRVVETLGDRASGDCAKLVVTDIGESKYHIDEYDGYESVITELEDDYWK